MTNHPFDLEVESVEVEKYDHGGMSGGKISMDFWKKEALPLLIQRLQKQ